MMEVANRLKPERLAAQAHPCGGDRVQLLSGVRWWNRAVVEIAWGMPFVGCSGHRRREQLGAGKKIIIRDDTINDAMIKE